MKLTPLCQNLSFIYKWKTLLCILANNICLNISNTVSGYLKNILFQNHLILNAVLTYQEAFVVKDRHEIQLFMNVKKTWFDCKKHAGFGSSNHCIKRNYFYRVSTQYNAVSLFAVISNIQSKIAHHKLSVLRGHETVNFTLDH